MARRRRRKSYANRLLSDASRSLPFPLQYAVSSPSRLLLSLVVVGFLLSVGVISIQWQNGRPQLEYHEEKAQELRGKTVEWVEEHGEELLHREPEQPPRENSLSNTMRRIRASIRRD